MASPASLTPARPTKQPIDRDRVWDDLREGIEQLYDKGHLTQRRYIQLYTHVWDFVITVSSEDPGPSVPGGVKSSLLIEARAAGYDLYKRLEKFLQSHLEVTLRNSVSAIEGDVTKFYSSEWDRFRASSKTLSNIFVYLDRIWFAREQEDPNSNVFKTYHLCMHSWRRYFLDAVQKQLTNALLRLIEQERWGVPVNVHMLRNIIFSYVAIALPGDDSDKRPSLTVYKTFFEDVFLTDTARFYSREGTNFLEKHTVSEYLIKVELLLAEEKRRVEQYLHASTLEPLVNTCRDVLLREHLGVFDAELKNFLISDKNEELSRAYRLLLPVTAGVDQLRTLFQEHAWTQGLRAIECLGKVGAQDPKLYVGTLLRVHEKYRALVVTAFGGDTRFLASVDKTCTKLINENAVTQLAHSSRKSAELLARYCHMLLEKNPESIEYAEREDKLDKAMVVFGYLEDKDVFQKFYRRKLAKRLVEHSSAFRDLEASMISKLKLANGYEYVSTLERMLQDNSSSDNMSQEFLRRVNDSGNALGLTFAAQVFSTWCWPFQDAPALSLPEPLGRCVDLFTKFYRDRHSGRRLRWLYHISKGELTSNCFKSAYTLQASSLEMAVLLQYNSALSFTVQQLQESTGLEMSTLQSVLSSLLKFQLLVSSNEGTEKDGELLPCSVVSLNEDFNSNNLFVNINAPLVSEAKVVHEATRSRVDHDRYAVIQASVVRIMKERKTLHQEELITEVSRRLCSMFQPSAAVIRECIDMLVRKEYIEKIGGEQGFSMSRLPMLIAKSTTSASDSLQLLVRECMSMLLRHCPHTGRRPTETAGQSVLPSEGLHRARC